MDRKFTVTTADASPNIGKRRLPTGSGSSSSQTGRTPLGAKLAKLRTPRYATHVRDDAEEVLLATHGDLSLSDGKKL